MKYKSRHLLSISLTAELRDRINSISRKRIKWTVTAAVFSLFFCFCLINNVTDYVHDAAYYWNRANGMLTNSGFSFLGYEAEYYGTGTFRGYFLSFILLVLKTLGIHLLGNEFILFMIANSAMFTIFIVWIMPSFFSDRLTNLRYLFGSLFCVICTCFFWPVSLKYPLSDAPSMIMLFGALSILKGMHARLAQRDLQSYLKIISWSFLCGILLYAAYNTRLVYLYAEIAAIIVFLILNRKAPLLRIAISIVIMLTGASLVALPQMVINKQNNGVFSPRIFEEKFLKDQESLIGLQLSLGIYIDQYITYIGDEMIDESTRMPPALTFYDSTGLKILSKEDYSISDSLTIPQMIDLWLKYPIDFIGIYGRHIVSYLSPIYEDTYVNEIYGNHAYTLISAIILWFIGALSLTPISRKENHTSIGKHWLLFACVLIPCIFMIPAQPEIRFVMPAYFLLYTWLAYCAEEGNILQYIKRNYFTVIVVFLSVLVLWISTIGSILGTFRENTWLINDRGFVYVASNDVLLERNEIELDQTGETVATVNIPISLTDNGNYIVSFDIDLKQSAPKMFYVDFYGPGYDNARQDLIVDLKSGPHSYRYTFNAGDVPDNIDCRIVYISIEPITVKNFKIQMAKLKYE